MTALDWLNGLALTAGVFLRSSVVARVAFVLYLLLLHLWTFVILTFRTTSFETPHADITGSFENEQLGDPPAMPGMRSRGFAAERSHGQW